MPFIYDPDPNFDEKISYALRYQCKDLTGVKIDFERFNIYLNYKSKSVAGAIFYVHGKTLVRFNLC